MKEFTLLITVLFNFISGEHQEIHLEIQQDSLSDCQSELEEMNEIGISFFGNRVDVMIECIESEFINKKNYKYDYKFKNESVKEEYIL